MAFFMASFFGKVSGLVHRLRKAGVKGAFQNVCLAERGGAGGSLMAHTFEFFFFEFLNFFLKVSGLVARLRKA